ncbi:MAG: reverse transcriptase family protein [Candidatus Obscuribacterales bacterium]|nr:reverse transcriptase family protein [Candidatus Obscuribacterales bacterium]
MDYDETKTALSALDVAGLCQKLGLVHQFVLDVAKDPSVYYEHFERPKKKGGVRKISASTGRLKRIQRQILDGLLATVVMPPYVHGCVKGRSVATNAAVHVGHDVVINIDLKDFFGTVNSARIQDIFQKYFGMEEASAVIFANLCTYQNHLPQGAPTSPTLANLAALELDERILEMLKGVYNYTRYVDDITISGAKDLVSLLPQIYQAVEGCGFVCNLDKTRILRQSMRQSVTGIVVNKKLNPSKRFIRKVRQNLYYCIRFGLNEHCESLDIKPHNFIREMQGRIGYIRMTQENLADNFANLLKDILPMSEISDEEKNLLLLRTIIDNERMVAFMYEESHRQAAPTEIYVDENDDTIFVKAFQFAPEPGWVEYRLAYMSELTMQFNRLA